MRSRNNSDPEQVNVWSFLNTRIQGFPNKEHNTFLRHFLVKDDERQILHRIIGILIHLRDSFYKEADENAWFIMCSY